MKKTIAIAALLFVASAGTAVAGTYSTLTTSAPVAQRNVRGTAKVVIKPAAGYSINGDYPMKLTVVPPSGVTVEKTEQVRADATSVSATGIEFTVAFTASTAGVKTLTGEARYAVSSPSNTMPVSDKFSINVQVQ